MVRATSNRADKMVQTIRSPKVHDVVVVGSGAAGGMAAFNLARKGVDVLLLDAGDEFDRSQYWTHVLPFEGDERLRRGETPPPFFLDGVMTVEGMTLDDGMHPSPVGVDVMVAGILPMVERLIEELRPTGSQSRPR